MTLAKVDLHLIDDIAHSLFGLFNYHMGTVPTWLVANEDLWDLCRCSMGEAWCSQYETASECAAMILALHLLKQIEVD